MDLPGKVLTPDSRGTSSEQHGTLGQKVPTLDTTKPVQCFLEREGYDETSFRKINLARVKDKRARGRF